MLLVPTGSLPSFDFQVGTDAEACTSILPTHSEARRFLAEQFGLMDGVDGVSTFLAQSRVVDFLQGAGFWVQTSPADNVVPCECGEATGQACDWSGPESETVVVDFLPAWRRQTHVASGASVRADAPGSIRIRCYRACADSLVEDADGWAGIA